MALTIYPTDGYNSFVSVIDADAIIDTSVHYASWEALLDADKERYLIAAFRNISILDVTLPSAPTTCLEEAQALMAIHDVVNSLSSVTDTAGQIKSAKVGSVAVEYTTGSPKTTVSPYPKEVQPCLSDLGAVFGMRLQRA